MPIYHKITEKMLDYLFDELEDHAKMMEESHGIQVLITEFWYDAIRKELTDGLVNAVEPLENVPDSETRT